MQFFYFIVLLHHDSLWNSWVIIVTFLRYHWWSLCWRLIAKSHCWTVHLKWCIKLNWNKWFLQLIQMYHSHNQFFTIFNYTSNSWTKIGIGLELKIYESNPNSLNIFKIHIHSNWDSLFLNSFELGLVVARIELNPIPRKRWKIWKLCNNMIRLKEFGNADALISFGFSLLSGSWRKDKKYCKPIKSDESQSSHEI